MLNTRSLHGLKVVAYIAAATFFLKFLLAAIWGDTFHEGDSIFVIEDFGVEFFHAALMSNNRWLAGCDM